ncbi:cell envelope integrity protein TolA [Shewanella sp. VB17]|uniref:cell envelope integrity protein TolA n=1 Tax=Shewanella sp. VB17 TaxID=2739432 RepID=UPI001563711F|nr:cell envelope integrity protein TolA [Shewanella sp. VB17]NRD73760.1 cell envelope integrity protein TolA [Shewanella sp. VB17]
MRVNIKFPLVISASIHIGVIVILAIGVDFSEKPKPHVQASAPAVQAVVVDQNKVTQHVERLKAEKRESARKEKARQDKLAHQLQQAREERKREQAQINKLEQQRKLKEIETNNATKAANLAQEKEKQAKALAQQAEADRKLKEQERKASEAAAEKAAAKRKQEEVAAKKASDKRKADEKTRQLQEKMMQEALAAEQASLSQTRNKQLTTEVDRYTSMIRATIQRNLVVDESMRGKSCLIFIRLASDGFVTGSKVVSGDPVVCRAIKTAMNKAGRLPVSSEPAVYNELKEINLTVQPEFN